MPDGHRSSGSFVARRARDGARQSRLSDPSSARATAAFIEYAALTPAERRVVARAAAGQTNRAIAEALFVTPKTVELHLRNAYRKLGASSRHDLAGLLRA